MTELCRIAVVGLGLAGASVLRALGQAAPRFSQSGVGHGWSGLEVLAIEAADGPATGASGNPLGILHPLHSADDNLGSRFIAAGLATSLRWLKELGSEAQGWAGLMGVQEQGQPSVDPGGWVKPAAFVAACLADAKAQLGSQLTVSFGEAVTAERVAALMADRTLVIVCTGHDDLLKREGLQLMPIAGQVSWVAASPTEGPDRVVCGEGYVAPVVDGQLLVGASFQRGEAAPVVTAQAHQENFERLRGLLPDLADRLADRWREVRGRASVRWASLDRMPHIGRPSQLDLLSNHPHPQRISQLHHLPRQDRLFLLMGLGSRGLTIAPLGAELVVESLLGEGTQGKQEMQGAQGMQGTGPSSLLDSRLIAAVDPARFLLRAHQRGRLSTIAP